MSQDKAAGAAEPSPTEEGWQRGATQLLMIPIIILVGYLVWPYLAEMLGL